jgi:hypothetical protein
MSTGFTFGCGEAFRNFIAINGVCFAAIQAGDFAFT